MNITARDAVVAAIQKAATLTHAASTWPRTSPTSPSEKMAKLCRTAAHQGDVHQQRAEAVENAVKIAARPRGAPRSSTATASTNHDGMTLTSKVGYKLQCGLRAGVYRILFPTTSATGTLDLRRSSEGDRAPARGFSDVVSPEHLAAIVLGPSGRGLRPAPAAYLGGAAAICDEHGILLVCDESSPASAAPGAGRRTSTPGSPDISTWAKSMGGGFPSRRRRQADVMDAAKPGTLGGTYGGNPIACAAALATIEAMESLDLNARAEAIGAATRARFEKLKAECDVVADVRGLGAMIGLELCFGRDPRRPAAQVVAKALKAAQSKGVSHPARRRVMSSACSPLTIEYF